MHVRQLVALNAFLLTLAAAGAAAASTVQVVAAIQSFSGDVGSSAQFSTYFDQHDSRGPLLLCPDAGCGTGIGRATIDSNTPEDPANGRFDLGASDLEFWNTNFGAEQTHNRIQFVAAPPTDVVLGQDFLLGSITYTNGIWFTNPTFEMTFLSVSSDPALDGFLWTGVLELSITPNSASNTPAQNADFLWFTNLPSLGSIRAYELADSPTGSNTVTVDVYGRINSVDLSHFANATGGGFLHPSVGLLPEPSSAGLLLAGVAGLGWLGRRRP